MHGIFREPMANIRFNYTVHRTCGPESLASTLDAIARTPRHQRDRWAKRMLRRHRWHGHHGFGVLRGTR
jgi:hypothetical protein